MPRAGSSVGLRRTRYPSTTGSPNVKEVRVAHVQEGDGEQERCEEARARVPERAREDEADRDRERAEDDAERAGQEVEACGVPPSEVGERRRRREPEGVRREHERLYPAVEEVEVEGRVHEPVRMRVAGVAAEEPRHQDLLVRA